MTVTKVSSPKSLLPKFAKVLPHQNFVLYGILILRLVSFIYVSIPLYSRSSTECLHGSLINEHMLLAWIKLMAKLSIHKIVTRTHVMATHVFIRTYVHAHINRCILWYTVKNVI